jgi:hypothetical protein
MRPREATLANDVDRLRERGAGKFAIGKSLTALSEDRPEVLYPLFDRFAELLDEENRLIKWTALRILANLAAADVHGRVEAILDRYLAPIAGPEMITSANAIAGAARITASQPHLAGRIIAKILEVEHAVYQTEECRNIAIGHALKALGSLEDLGELHDQVVAFANRQTTNLRPATRKKAERLLKTLRVTRSALPRRRR